MVGILICCLFAVLATCSKLPAQQAETDTVQHIHSLELWYGGGITLEGEDILGENGVDVDPAVGIGIEYTKIGHESGWWWGTGAGLLVGPGEEEDAAYFPVVLLQAGLDDVGLMVGYASDGKVYVDLVGVTNLIIGAGR